MNKEVYKFLKAEAEADKAKALASIKLLTKYPAGIGDHSTRKVRSTWEVLFNWKRNYQRINETTGYKNYSL